MSLGSNRRADRTNRVVLTVVGLTLTAAAATGLIASATNDGATPVVSSEQRQWLLDHASLLAVAGAAVTLGVLVLALLWLRHQLRPIPEEHDTTVTATGHGSTILRTDALTDVVAQELRDLDGVTDANARVRSSDPDTIDVLLDLDDSTGLEKLTEQISNGVLTRARRAIGNQSLGMTVECRPVRTPAPPRVA